MSAPIEFRQPGRGRGRHSNRLRARAYAVEDDVPEHRPDGSLAQPHRADDLSSAFSAVQLTGPPPGYSNRRHNDEHPQVERGGRSSRRGHRWHAPPNTQLNPHASEWQPNSQHSNFQNAASRQRQFASYRPPSVPSQNQRQPDYLGLAVRGSGHDQQERPPPRRAGQCLPSTSKPSNSSKEKADKGPASTKSETEAVPQEHPACVICCEDLMAAAVGKCNHKDICAMCSLRMRMCYKQTQCPLCKADLNQVVMTRWRPGGIPDWNNLSGDMSMLWTNLSWQRNVFVDNRPVEGVPVPQRLLSAELESRTSIICSICDPGGRRSYPSHKSLLRHMETEHGRTLCTVCLKNSRQFPAEMTTLDEDELQKHLEEHPECMFCQVLFFGLDELFEHLRTLHYWCTVCQQQGGNVYFPDLDSYVEHISTEHFCCAEAACRSFYVAFATVAELDAHMREVHHLPRQHGRGRRGTSRMVLRPPSSDLPRGPRSSRGPDTSESMPPRSSRGTAAQPTGFRMIDDDLGMLDGPLPSLADQDAEQALVKDCTDETNLESLNAAATVVIPSHAGDSMPGVHGNQSQATEQRPAPFPSLASTGPQQLSRTAPRRSESSRLPRLVSVTRRCDCGRRTDHPVIPEGSDPGMLPCNAECERQKRRAQLASAFDIPDPDRHRPVMDRTRLVEHSPELLDYAKRNLAWIENIERVLVGFVESAGHRYRFPPMCSEQRKILHQMAGSFGLISHGCAPEPHRHIELLKGGETFVPRNLLSREAASTSFETIAEQLAQTRGFELRLTDVSPTADLRRWFRRWDGEVTIEGPSRDGNSVIRFPTESAMQEATSSFGGGVRGVFRIQRRQPGQAVAARNLQQFPQSDSSGQQWQPVAGYSNSSQRSALPRQQRIRVEHPFAALREGAQAPEDWEEHANAS